MTRARYLVGDVFDMLATLPDDSVDLVMTSPPFLALRSYLPAGHPDKGKEIGSEATPADFLDTLLDVVEALDRVIAPHGSLVFELGDTYSGSGGAGGDYNEGGLRDGAPKFTGSALSYRRTAQRNREGQGTDAWPLDKSLCGIPTLFAWSLAYGRNLLRPERTTPQWRIRNVIAWCRPNPPVGALGDKVRPATSYLTVATKARDRYFDLDAVRTASDYDRPNLRGAGSRGPGLDVPGQKRNQSDHTVNPAGAPPLDYWVIPTQPTALAHFATYPEKLCEIPIKAMCPLKVCQTCEQPSRRVIEDSDRYAERKASHAWSSGGMDKGHAKPASTVGWDDGTPVIAERVTVGWTDCGHDNWRSGVVLDPFGGSGTTGKVATGHGRDAVLIDIDARNADLALQRVGPLLLTIETPEAVA